MSATEGGVRSGQSRREVDDDATCQRTTARFGPSSDFTRHAHALSSLCAYLQMTARWYHRRRVGMQFATDRNRVANSQSVEDCNGDADFGRVRAQLLAAEVPHAPINSPAELLHDRHNSILSSLRWMRAVWATTPSPRR